MQCRTQVTDRSIAAYQATAAVVLDMKMISKDRH
jgi:hypothetical protein